MTFALQLITIHIIHTEKKKQQRHIRKKKKQSIENLRLFVMTTKFYPFRFALFLTNFIV